MYAKVSAGDSVAKSPAKSARWLNATSEATAFYQQQKRLGSGISSVGLKQPTDLVKVQNITGANRARGEVLQLGEALLTELDTRNLWFEGNTVAAPSYLKYVILREDLPAGEEEDEENGAIGLAQGSGICTALVDVTDEAHTHAFPVIGEHVLSSGFSGPIEILSPITETGEQELCVRLLVVAPTITGFLTEALSQGSSAEMAICTFDDTDTLIDTTERVDIWDTKLNVGDDEVPANTRVDAWWDYRSNRYIWSVGHCEAEEEENLPQAVLESIMEDGDTLDAGDADSESEHTLDGGDADTSGDILDGGSA